jgi:hypothetical protein
MFDLVALVIALQSARSESVELVWRPEPGSVLERDVEFEVRGGLDEGYVGLSLLGLSGLADVSVQGHLRVSDEIVRVADGRPLELRREFERLTTTWDGLARCEVHPELLERALVYTWDESAGTYAREWARSPTSRVAPPALREDLDLRALLPGEPVRVGDLWRVPVSSVAGLLAPAGALHVDEDLGEAWGFDELAQAFDIERVQRIRDGEVECLLKRIVRVDGRRLAVIEVGWEWWGTIDPFLTPRADTWLARIAPGSSICADLDGRAWGRLLWDLEGGHAHEFELQAEVSGLHGARGSRCGLRFHARGSWFTTITPR